MTEKNIRIVQINIQSLEKNKEELSRLLIQDQYNVAFISETWSKLELESTKYKVPGYFSFLDSRDDGYGGAGLIISKRIKTREVFMPSFNKIQVIARHIVSSDICLVSVYVAPKISHFELRDNIGAIFKEVQKYRKAVIAGDFNSHHVSWDPNHSDNKGATLFELINDENLILLNTGEATFVPVELGKSQSAIDLVMVTPSLIDCTTMRTLDFGIGSRHLALETTIQLCEEKPERYFINGAKVKAAINEMSSDSVSGVKDLQTETRRIVKRARQKDKYVPKFWWSTEVEKAWQEKREARVRFNRTGGMQELIEFKRSEAVFNRIKKESQKQRFKEFVESIDPRTPSKIIWEKLRRLTGRKRSTANVLVHENMEMAQEFLDKFFPVEDLVEEFPRYLPNYDVMDINFWNRFLAKKTVSTSPGPDGISYSMLRLLNSDVREVIIQDLNNIWKSTSIPFELKSIKVVAIPKPGKNPETVEGTRPISMINCCLKILNAAVLEKLELHLQQNHILPDLSFGFRKGTSTMSCLEYVVNRIQAGKRKGLIVGTIFVDLSNAFNAVKPETLEAVLQSYAVPPELSSWIMAFLTNRRIELQVGDQKAVRYVHQGLPQGDVLSPTLFNVYTAKLHEIQVEGVILVQYADDFSIIVMGRSIEELNERGNAYMERFAQLAESLNFTINAQKTKAVLFLNSPREMKIAVNDEDIESVRWHRYLGVLIDKSLRFGSHIRELTQKMADRLNMLKVISGTKYGAHPGTLNVAYNALIRSFIEYGTSVYSSACNTNLKKLDTINNQCLRRVTGCTKTTPRNTLQAIAAQPPLQFRRMKMIGRQVVKHCYSKSPVWDQMCQDTLVEEFCENQRYTAMEKSAFLHHDILEQLSTMVKEPYRWGDVQICTTLKEGTWVKKETCTKVLKQLSLSLIHGKYSGRQLIFTDASSDGVTCGIGVYHEARNFRLSLRLANTVCIMSAELEAIYVALQYIRTQNLQNAVIMTDSKSGCEYIRRNKRSYERDEVIDNILRMATEYNTSIQWIPGHTGLNGNEVADQLAKAGLEQETVCSNKILLHDAINHIHTISEQSSQQWYLQYAAELGKGRKYFQIQNTIPAKPWHHKLQLNNTEVRTLNRLLSGHDFSRYWLHKMKIEEDCICDVCDVLDNSDHVMFFCVKYAKEREKYQLDEYCNIYQVFEKKDVTLLQNVVRFLKDIKSHI